MCMNYTNYRGDRESYHTANLLFHSQVLKWRSGDPVLILECTLWAVIVD